MIRVVIAEDDRSVARLIARVITTMGYHPVLCSDGQRALNVLEDNPDTRLLITDVSMPNMDGKKLVQHVRDSDKLGDLPVIIISAVVTVSEISHLTERGDTYFLGKPLNVADLREHVRSLIDHALKQPVAASSSTP